MIHPNPKYGDPAALRDISASDVRRILEQPVRDSAALAVLMSPAAGEMIEDLASHAADATTKHFGRTISLYVPLYLSNHCSGGCAYCGFASDREQSRTRLEPDQLASEINALADSGFEDVLLLTGERCDEADFDYLQKCVAAAANRFHNVTVESFAMSEDEYRALAESGCTGVTLYQETYDRDLYDELHRWGPKRDYDFRLAAPERAFSAGMRTVGMGSLLGLAEPVTEMMSLFDHVEHVRKTCWQGGISVSFPRICAEQGGYEAQYPVNDRKLAQIIFAFRICMPDVPLVLSTRERPSFRDGIAGIGISRMSVASRTTVGGYHDEPEDAAAAQFSVNDGRDVETFCSILKTRGLEPVFKNWDSVFQGCGPREDR